MKARQIIVLASAALCGCDHYPKHLTPAEQIQAVVFERLASDRLSGQKISGDSLRLFLSVTDGMDHSDMDPPKGVYNYMTGRFPSTRPFRAAIPISPDQTSVVERSTKMQGIILRVAPVSVTDDGPIPVRASYFFDGTGSEGFEFQVRRVEGKWRIVGEKVLWVT